MPLESVAFQTAQEHAPFTSPTIFFVSRFAKFKQFQIKNPKRDGRSNYVIKLSLTTFTERCRLVKPSPHVLGGKAKALSWQISKKTTPDRQRHHAQSFNCTIQNRYWNSSSYSVKPGVPQRSFLVPLHLRIFKNDQFYFRFSPKHERFKLFIALTGTTY
jgi:hypothetical protein